MWDCIKSEGFHLGTCSDRFLFGSCCYHNTTFNDIDIQKPNTTLANMLSNDSSRPTSVGSSGMSIPSSDSTTQTPMTSFLQSTSNLSDQLGSLINQQRHQSTMDSGNQTIAIGNQALKNNNTNKVHYQQSDMSSSWSQHEQSPDHSPVQISTQHTTPQPVSTTTTPPVAYSQQDSSASNSRPYLIQQQQQQQDSNQASSQVSHHTTATRPSAIYQAASGGGGSQQPEQVSTIINSQPPQRPYASSWLSKPVSLIANAFFPSFKPFPYLIPSKPRPTYRPYINRPYINRPPHYRPSLPQQKPLMLINGVQQIANQGGELVSSTSENSFSNSPNNSSNSIMNSTASLIQDNNDIHVVNPSSPSMTDRHRPIDKNQFSHLNNDNHLDQMNQQKHHHYEILNLPSSGAENGQTNPNASYNQNDANYTPTIMLGGSYSRPTSSLPFDSIGQQGASVSHTNVIGAQQTSVTPVITEPTIYYNGNGNSNSSYNNNNNNDLGIVTNAYPNYGGHPKPVSAIEQQQQQQQQHNESVNYPSYPLISNFPSQNIHQPPAEGHFSSLSPIDGIHGLSINQYSPSKENLTTVNVVSPPDEYTNHPNFGGQFDDSSSLSQSASDNRQKPPAIQDSGLATTPILPSATILIGNIDAPSPTTAISVSMTTSTYPASMVQDSATIQPPPSTFAPSRTTISSQGANDGGKKGTNGFKEATCGVTSLYPQTKVVGGKNAAFGAWPWQVSVRKVSFFGFSSTHRCGGAVISSEWIATAGHCVEDLALPSIRIRVGEYDFSSMAEPFPYIERAARRKVVHPKYNFYTYENDLALVQLDQPIQFPPHVAPICLPPDNIDLLGRNATVTGWGRLNEGGTLPTILQEVRVPIVSNDKCKDMFDRAGRPEYIPDIFLCAGYEEGGRDSCQGDSGGPLQVKGDDGKWFLAGIISWGIGCAEQNLPGVCTRISRFKLWIQSTMNSSS